MAQMTVDSIPVIFEHKVTILVKDVPLSYDFYDAGQVKNVLKNLKALGKKYIHKVSIHNIH